MSLFDPRLVIFSGKGGVGKTTVASGYALACAKRGERTLVMELDVKDRLSSYFGSEEVGSEIMEIEENLHAVNVTPDAALEEYGTMILRMKMLYRAVFENRIVRRLLEAIPGLDDLLMIGKAYYHATEEVEDGEPVWDKVVVDAPATGHGLFLLQIPAVITSTLSSGHMHEKAEEILDFLRDPDRAVLNLVTLAEEMPVNETLMLRDQASERLGVDVDRVIVNGLYPELFGDEFGGWIDEAWNDEAGIEGLADDEVVGLLEAAQFRRQRIDLQRRYRGELRREVATDLVEVPFFFTDRITFPNVEAIADAFLEAAGDAETSRVSEVSEEAARG